MIIGISGKARVGKDTTGGIFKEELLKAGKGEFQLMEYSRVLKECLTRDFNLSHEQLYGDLKEVVDERYTKQNTDPVEYWTPREILQEYGETMRSIDIDFWVNNAFKNEHKNIILTDVRHKNEVKAVKDRGGYFIRIHRDHDIEVHGTDHISETVLDFIDNDGNIGSIYKPDFEIENNGSIKDLTNVVRDIILMIDKLETVNKNFITNL